MTVALYVRISSDPFVQRAGVTRQIADTKQIARDRGWGDDFEIFEDNDQSAYKGRRPAFEDLIERIGEFEAIVAWDHDRFVRHPRDLERFIDAAEKVGLRRFCTAKGDIDLSTHDGQLQARILTAVAKKSSDDTARRVARAAQDRAERGLWVSGRPPFGYRMGDRKGEIVQTDDAEIVREAAGIILDGGSLAGVVRRYSGTGAPTTIRGWKLLLLTPTIAGRTTTGHEALWEPIISPAESAQLRTILTDPSRRSAYTTERQWWLSGLAHCAVCDALLHVAWSRRQGRKEARVWRCPDCGGVTIRAHLVEPYVEGAILEAAPHVRAQPEPVPAFNDPDQEARLAELAGMYVSGQIGRAEWLAARGLITQHTQAPNPTAPIPAPNENTAAAWSNWNPTERHRAAAFLLRSVIVAPLADGDGSLDDRIKLVWRR